MARALRVFVLPKPMGLRASRWSPVPKLVLQSFVVRLSFLYLVTNLFISSLSVRRKPTLGALTIADPHGPEVGQQLSIESGIFERIAKNGVY